MATDVEELLASAVQQGVVVADDQNSLRVGERFRGEPVLFDRKLSERFVAVAPTGETPVAAREGSEPAGFVPIGAPGLWILGYRSRPSRVRYSRM